MSNYLKTTALITFVIILGIASALVLFRIQSGGGQTTKNSDLENKTGKISLKSTFLPEEALFIENISEKYSIVIPDNWIVDPDVTLVTGIQIFFEEGNNPLEASKKILTYGGVMLNIVTIKNEEKISTLDWLAKNSYAKSVFKDARFKETVLAGYDAFTTNIALSYKELQNIDVILVPSEYMETEVFVVGNKDRIFIIYCMAFDETEKYITMCENVVKTFNIL